MNSASFPVSVTARLAEPLQPLDRGDRYEDPLEDFLTSQSIGNVDGGGTLLSPGSAEILACEVNMYLTNDTDALAAVREELERLGAPVGSRLFVISHEGAEPREIPMGTRERLTLYLDGTSLPDEVYEQTDIDDILGRVMETLEQNEVGELRGANSLSTETALYLSGPSAAAIDRTLQPIYEEFPVFSNARLVFHTAAEPREIRLPRR